MGVDRNINKVKSLLANFKNLCTQHNYIPTDTEKENKKRIEERIVEFEQHVAKEREDYKQKTQQLKDTPITGDFFRVDYNGYCIHTFNHDVCKHCSRRSWNDNHWEEGNRCRID